MVLGFSSSRSLDARSPGREGAADASFLLASPGVTRKIPVMPGQSKRKDPPLLGYSTNVHRGESLAQVYRFLKEYTIPIKNRVFGGEPAGLELRLGIGSTRDLQKRRALREFRDFLERSGLELFSINAFPLLDFHARRVKEKVYRPSWCEAQRGLWTSRIARVFAELLPEGIEGSVSTLGGCYRREGHEPRTFRRMAGVFLKTLETFLELGREGRSMVLAVEPEPETTFETTQDVIDFVEGYLLPLAFERWRKHGRRAAIEENVRRHFAVNVDTCHLSVLFEDPVDSLRRLERAGVRLGKLHVTNAVALRNPYRSPAAYQDLRRMDEPRYLHQFCGVDRRGQLAWRDLDLDRLPRRLERGRHPDVVEIRSHFHVPLYRRRYHRLHTTQDDTVRAVREVVRRRWTRHLVLETYTWPILAGKERQREKLLDGITREFRWLLRILGK